MQEARNGDVRKLGTLFERHQRPLFNYYLRMTGNRDKSEDLVQDVFFRILRSRHTYREGTSFQTWMYTIARNARIDAGRRQRPEVELDPERDSTRDTAPSPADALAASQEQALLRRALAALPEDRRELLILSRYQNLKYEQIGRMLGCETGAVKLRVFRAVRELRDIYHELAGRTS